MRRNLCWKSEITCVTRRPVINYSQPRLSARVRLITINKRDDVNRRRLMRLSSIPRALGDFAI